MQQRWQNRGWLWAALMLGACADGATQDDMQHELEDPSNEDAIGGLSLALTSVDNQGRSYRLRDAVFSISSEYGWYYDGGTPPPPTTLSTETDPDADRLTARLLPGGYRVALEGDWYLERLGPNGPQRVQQAVLLTNAVQYAYIYDGWNYDLDFRFGVDGTLIDFRHGDLNVDISIELPGEGPGYPWYDASLPLPVDAGVALDGGSVFPF
jgi:hypothetical protein